MSVKEALLPTKRIFGTVAVTWGISLWCWKGKAFGERPFALHRQQPEKDKQNVDFTPHGHIFGDAHGLKVDVWNTLFP